MNERTANSEHTRTQTNAKKQTIIQIIWKWMIALTKVMLSNTRTIVASMNRNHVCCSQFSAWTQSRLFLHTHFSFSKNKSNIYLFLPYFLILVHYLRYTCFNSQAKNPSQGHTWFYWKLNLMKPTKPYQNSLKMEPKKRKCPWRSNITVNRERSS